MDFKTRSAAAEAMLFAAGDPVEPSKIAEVLEAEKQEAEEILEHLRLQYMEKAGGIQIIRVDGSYQMCSNPDYAQQVRGLLEIKRNQPLSQAALEVLAIISYNQPVTKAFIEQVRGVDCSGVIASLGNKNLIEETGRLDLPGRPLLYGTTQDFLRCFTLESLDDLPELPKQDVPDENADQLTLAETLQTEEQAETQTEPETVSS